MDAPDADAVPHDLVFVDLETTGGNAAYHRITEIGIVRVHRDAVVEEWSTLVNPECVIPSYIESFTGITNEMVEGAPRFADIAGLVLEKLCAPTARPRLAPSRRCSQRTTRASTTPFMRAEFRRAGMPFSAPVLCTVKLSRRLFPEHPRHNLDAVMERHALIVQRAASGARRCAGAQRVSGRSCAASIAEPDLAAAPRGPRKAR